MIAQYRDLLNVIPVDNFDFEFTKRLVGTAVERCATYSLETATHSSLGERATSLIGSVVRTIICLKSPDGTSYSHTVPSSHPMIA